MSLRALERALVGVAGAGLLVLAVMGSGFVLFLALLAQPPDAYAPESEPCCTPPDTWGQFAEGVGAVLVAAALAGLLAGSAVAVLSWVAGGPRMPVRLLALSPLIALLAVVGVIAVNVVPSMDGARTTPDCDEAVVVPGSVRTEAGVPAQDVVARCGLVDGATRTEARLRLGAPGRVEGRKWRYDRLELTFGGGRVVRAVFAE